MALQDDEQRKLAEIERRLVADDPRLAGRFAERLQLNIGAISAVIMMLMAGIVIIVVGVQLGSPLLVVIGGVVAGTIPAMIASRPHC